MEVTVKFKPYTGYVHEFKSKNFNINKDGFDQKRILIKINQKIKFFSLDIRLVGIPNLSDENTLLKEN